jgi:hypothetical protein
MKAGDSSLGRIENTSVETQGRELYELELRVARRADELARTVVPHQDRNCECWLRAEREVIGEWAGSKPHSLLV